MMTVGIDLAESGVKAVAVSDDGKVQARSAQSPPRGDLAVAVRDAFREVHGSGQSPALTGVTLPFQDDALPDAVAATLKQQAGQAPATISPGHAIVLAETWCGAARDYANVISFAIGEHVIAGILIGGSLLKGANGHAGSVAWVALNPVEREDYRRHGGLEAEVSAAGIVRRLVWRIKSGDRSLVVDQVGGDLTRITADDVFAAARAGDGVCISVVRDTAKYVGMAVANLATIVDPECVVLGGALAASGDLMLDAIRTECSRRLRPAQCDRVQVVLSTLGADAGAIGAARAAQLQQR